MKKTSHPIAARYPPDLTWLSGEELLPLALLSPAMQQQLLADMQDVVRIQYQVLVAQQLLSQLDLYALYLTYQTTASAELLRAMYGWTGELDEFDQAWQQQYLQTMQEMVTLAHTQVLTDLKGE